MELNDPEIRLTLLAIVNTHVIMLFLGSVLRSGILPIYLVLQLLKGYHTGYRICL